MSLEERAAVVRKITDSGDLTAICELGEVLGTFIALDFENLNFWALMLEYARAAYRYHA